MNQVSLIIKFVLATKPRKQRAISLENKENVFRNVLTIKRYGVVPDCSRYFFTKYIAETSVAWMRDKNTSNVVGKIATAHSMYRRASKCHEKKRRIIYLMKVTFLGVTYLLLKE